MVLIFSFFIFSTPIFLCTFLRWFFKDSCVYWTSNIRIIFFSIWVFFHKHSQITGPQGWGKDISLSPHYHFHPFHGHLDISRAITAESSPLTSEPLVFEHKSLTTKLRALKYDCIHKQYGFIFTINACFDQFFNIVESCAKRWPQIICYILQTVTAAKRKICSG